MTRFKTACAFALLALLPATVAAQSKPQSKPGAGNTGPRLKLDRKEVDFGIIMHGSKAELTIAIQNQGTEELVLNQVKPSCGCTVARYPKTLAPGSVGKITLVFDSTDRPAGYQSYRLKIYSNDPTQRDQGQFCTIVSMRGEVKTMYRVAPHGAYFGEVIQGMGAVEKQVMITGRGDAAGGFKASLDGDVPDFLEVKTEPFAPTDRRKGVKVTVRLLPHVPLGALDHRLVFKTSFAAQPLFRIPVSALVNRRIAGPPAVHFGPVARGKGAERLVVIERRDTRDGIKVTRVRFDASRFVVTHEAISARRVEVKVNVKADAPPGPYAGDIAFFLDDPDQSLVNVPVYVRVEPRVRVDPPTALMPKGTKPGARIASFAIRLPAGKTVSGVAASDGLSAKLERDNKTWIVHVHAPESGELPTHEARLTLTTDVAGEHTTTVLLVAE